MTGFSPGRAFAAIDLDSLTAPASQSGDLLLRVSRVALSTTREHRPRQTSRLIASLMDMSVDGTLPKNA